MYLSLYLLLYFPGRRDGRVSGSAASFLSLTRGGRWRTSRGWSGDENKNSKVGFIRDIQSDSPGEGRAPSPEAEPAGLVGSHLPTGSTGPDQYVQHQQGHQHQHYINSLASHGLAKYHTQVLKSDSSSQHSPFLGGRIPLPIQPDGRRLDVEPRSECAAPRRRRLCQSWVSNISGVKIFSKNMMITIEKESYCFNAQVKEWNPSSSALQFDQYSRKLFLCSEQKITKFFFVFLLQHQVCTTAASSGRRRRMSQIRAEESHIYTLPPRRYVWKSCPIQTHSYALELAMRFFS